MGRKKECSGCGCERIITLVAKISIVEAGEITFGTKRLCVFCLLRFMGLSEGDGKYNFKKAMSVVDDS